MTVSLFTVYWIFPTLFIYLFFAFRSFSTPVFFFFGWVLKVDLLSPWVDSGTDLSKETRIKKKSDVCNSFVSREKDK